MPTFEVKVYELHLRTLTVSGVADEVEAVVAVLTGDSTGSVSRDGLPVFVEDAVEYGMPVDGNEDLVEAIEGRGIAVEESYVPVLHSVTLVEAVDA